MELRSNWTKLLFKVGRENWENHCIFHSELRNTWYMPNCQMGQRKESELSNSGCSSKRTYLWASSIELIGIYFKINLHRIGLHLNQKSRFLELFFIPHTMRLLPLVFPSSAHSIWRCKQSWLSAKHNCRIQTCSNDHSHGHIHALHCTLNSF